jgi:ribonuclease R
MTKKSKKNPNKLARTEANVKRDVLSFLRIHHDRTFNHKQIAAGVALKGEVAHHRLIEILDEMADKGLINFAERGKYSIVMRQKLQIGKLEVTRDGYGFVVLEEEKLDDIFIAPKKMGKALNGDTVKVSLTRSKSGNNRAEGEVVEVIERAMSTFIGRLEILNQTAIFIPDDPRIPHEFLVPMDKTGGAKPGEKVLLKLTNWEFSNPEGEVTRILGKAGENETEMHAILFQFGFDPEFPDAVEAEALEFPDKLPSAEIHKRRDMRNVTTFTIDPIDAKDFDDALSFQKLENGLIEVGVHIADVSYYVRPGTAIDREAYQRATSVYLVDRTVPMLPERLSNGLCSLVPHQDRFCFSAVFEMDLEGKIQKEWFGRTVIHSDHRFSYEGAQEVLDAGEGNFAEELLTLNRIAKIFQERRFKQGSIAFEDDEVKFELDEKARPVRVFRKVRKDAHKMIEDWMLLANRKVTEHVGKMRKGIPLPFIYRIHDSPDDEKLQTLKRFAMTLGFKLELDDTKSIAKALNGLMEQVSGKPAEGMIQTIAIRTMAKAIYATENIGHYGLGFSHYTHFTSPIRRYPDLLVHRMLAQYLAGDFSGNVEKLEAMARHCTARERRATEAERASIKHKQVEYLEERIGQQFEGIVAGVSNWGIYVELKDTRCEGMVGLHDMQDDYYEVDTEHYCVRGRSSGNVIRLGDRVLVEVKGTSLRNRTIDYLLIDQIDHHPAEKGRFIKKKGKKETVRRDVSKKQYDKRSKGRRK